MRNEYLNKVEDNASICTWSEKTQLEKGDSVTEGYTSELWDSTRVNSTQNELKELRDIWAQWDDENPAYSCFTFGDVDLVPTLEEYTTLLRCPRIQGHKAYVRSASLPTFTKKLVMITGMSEQWAVARVQQKGDIKCILWAVLRDLISTHPDVKKRVDVLALSIYGMVIFPKALGYIDEAVVDLFNRLGKQNTPVPAILAETIRSLSACRRAGEESHFWKLDKVPCRVFFEGYSPLKEAVDRLRRDDISEERWIDILQNLREKDVIWKAPWLVPSEVLYRCGSFDWGLAQSDFSYKGDHYKKRMREISEAWKKPFGMKILTKGSMSTLEYKGWFSKRVNDNVPRPILVVARSLEKSLRVIPSEVEVMKQEFERKNSELEKRIEKLEEEKMCLSLDVDVQKMEVEKVKKEKRKIEEDRDDLKTHYKKAQDCKLRIEQLEAREEQWKGELHHLRDQMRDRDHVMEEAIVQIRQVAEHLQDLAIQARTLSIMYESSSDRG
ncbi:hypothetical protein CXB51_009742 [Gossypium anomalum]|uniref:DUF7745 domain-containing protein n=1 Tax=Gossypium anomalum TaxID=47600 RepID=A0A8J5Z033_9ROSI|nr:hypothetical protein CXB51_009742 [Gossypium anomalum]